MKLGATVVDASEPVEHALANAEAAQARAKAQGRNSSVVILPFAAMPSAA